MRHLLVLLSLVLCSCCHVAPVTTKRISPVDRALECTVSIVGVQDNGNAVSGGTGVYVTNRIGKLVEIVTAHHVVKNKLIYLATGDGKDILQVEPVLQDEVADLALLVSTEPSKTNGCEVAIGAVAVQGDRILSSGYPPAEGMKQIVDGIVRSVVIDGKRREYMHTGPIDLGWSGGGLWNKLGDLIGINRAVSGVVVPNILGKMEFVARSGRSFAVHTDELIKFLARRSAK